MYNVSIIQRIVPHYRLPFFNALVGSLDSAGIELTLFFGLEYPGTVPKGVRLEEPWAEQIGNRYYHLLGNELVWQNCLTKIQSADLVIVEQANRLLINYILLLRRKFKKMKVAYWGHGMNFQSSNKNGIKERFKKWLIREADWWFAYTDMSAKYIGQSGFPKENITTVQNAIDDRELRIRAAQITADEIANLKASLNISGKHIAIFCGGMYPDKKLEFLLEACFLIKASIADFHIVFIGSGPDHYNIEKAARDHAWIHDVGPVTGTQRVPYFAISQCLLMPGLVGLVILDSFVLTTPIITTDISIHSPEICYLANGENGLVTSHCPTAYAKKVVDVMLSENQLATLRSGCEKSASRYTLDNMVENYARGILNCLQSAA